MAFLLDRKCLLLWRHLMLAAHTEYFEFMKNVKLDIYYGFI